MKSITRNALLTACLMLVTYVGLRADPVNVSYNVTGTSGNYTLNFSVTNNIDSYQRIYFFGAKLSGSSISDSPAGWDSTYWAIWNPALYGGSGPNIDFNNNWINFGLYSGEGIHFGDTLSGFSVHITDSEAPVSLDWFAYSYGDGAYYQGPRDFNNEYNPGFGGTTRQASAPDSASTLGLLGASVVGLALLRRRFAK